MPHSIYILIGYRGSGKTSVGTRLAKRLDLTFADVDDHICRRFGEMTVREIWQDHGEPAYRRVEVEVTADLCAKANTVIGLGGGTLMQEGARQAVEQADDALRVYLRAEPEQLRQRIEADPQSRRSRPNLTGLGGGVDEISHMLDQREPVYRAVADHEIDVTHMTVDAVVDWLVSR